MREGNNNSFASAFILSELNINYLSNQLSIGVIQVKESSLVI